MPAPSLLSFSNLVNNAAAACQASCNRLLNLAVGSVTRSILEACASIGLWIQYLIVQVWLSERLSTSQGTDVDSFVGDFDLTRLPSVAATGTVTFSRYTVASAALIVPYFNADGSINTDGAQVLTADLSQSFGVTTDPNQVAWSDALGGYFMPPNVQSIDVPVQAITPGSAGNIQAGAITLITATVPGVDYVTNNTVFSNGVDGEGDTALKARFATFIATRAEGTLTAIEAAIASVQQNLSYGVLENTLPTGVFRPGFFTVTADDGTGSPPAALITAVYQAVDAVRPICSTFTVQAPVIILAVVSMSITALPGFDKGTLQGQVADSVESYINGLGIGVTLFYTRLATLAYGIAGVASVSNVLLNNGTANIGGGPTQTVKATGASVVIN